MEIESDTTQDNVSENNAIIMTRVSAGLGFAFGIFLLGTAVYTIVHSQGGIIGVFVLMFTLFYLSIVALGLIIVNVSILFDKDPDLRIQNIVLNVMALGSFALVWPSVVGSLFSNYQIHLLFLLGLILPIAASILFLKVYITTIKDSDDAISIIEEVQLEEDDTSENEK